MGSFTTVQAMLYPRMNPFVWLTNKQQAQRLVTALRSRGGFTEIHTIRTAPRGGRGLYEVWSNADSLTEYELNRLAKQVEQNPHYGHRRRSMTAQRRRNPDTLFCVLLAVVALVGGVALEKYGYVDKILPGDWETKLFPGTGTPKEVLW